MTSHKESYSTPATPTYSEKWPRKFSKLQFSSERKRRIASISPSSSILFRSLTTNQKTQGSVYLEPNTQKIDSTDKNTTPRSLQFSSPKSNSSSIKLKTPRSYTPKNARYTDTPINTRVSESPVQNRQMETLHHTSSEMAPNVKHHVRKYIPKSSSTTKKLFKNELCTVCEEPISNRRSGEKIIELICDHFSHYECLALLCEGIDTKTNEDIYSIFPNCNLCMNKKDTTIKCIPSNGDIKDMLVSQFLLGQNRPDSYSKLTDSNKKPPSLSLLPSQVLAGPALIPFRSSSSIEPQTLMRNDSFRYNTSPLFTKIERNNLEHRNPSHNRVYSRNSEGKLLSTRNTINANIINRNLNNNSIRDRETKMLKKSTNIDLTKNSNKEKDPAIPIALLRSFYIQFLSSNFKEQISDWELDDKFGLLRLVDKLNISFDGNIYKEGICFLFKKAFITTCIDKKSTNSFKNDMDIINCKLQNLNIFALTKDVSIKTLNSAGLIFMTTSKNIYLTETCSNSSNMIQKWISGFLNKDIFFSSKAFTFTLPTMSVLNQSNSGLRNSSTFTGMLNENKALQITSLKDNHNSVLIKRGFKFDFPPESVQMTDIKSIQSILTNVSSIISLKRNAPDNITFILQLKNSLKSDKALKNIINILLVIKMIYPKTYLTLVDENAAVLYMGIILDSYLDLKKEIDRINPLEKLQVFSPSLLKGKLYAKSNIEENIGIAVISETPMKENSSCLMMNYSNLSSFGRKRANEIKIKIGYLNIDYSDKISELVEVDNWNFALEALCFSFSLNFDDYEENDTDLEIDFNDNLTLSFSNESSISQENYDISDVKQLSIPNNNEMLNNSAFEVSDKSILINHLSELESSPNLYDKDLILDFGNFNDERLLSQLEGIKISTPAGLNHLLDDIKLVIDEIGDSPSSANKEAMPTLNLSMQ